MYASDESLQPDEVVHEIEGQSSDINSGFGGKYVWLRPEWTTVEGEAISDLSFEKSSTPIRNYNDLAMGAGGDFRYVQASRDGSGIVTKIGLFRVKQELSPEEIKSRIEQGGFTQYSKDINEGRGGDYLYLLWAY
ncbi:hypothetical protein F4781DRAFT_435043 [Annulohypoxylon bovei var. microspora]|nr:hypothetical protein F4781DRAFT_435043 [Annulohypoxylon bovei var. microspora]